MTETGGVCEWVSGLNSERKKNKRERKKKEYGEEVSDIGSEMEREGGMGWEHERLRKSLARGKLILPGPAVLMPTRSPAERKRVSCSGRVTAKMTGGRVCVCGARVGEGGKGESKDLWIANTGTVFSGVFFFV